MTTLADVLAMVREELGDADAELWTDEALTRAINRAVAEYGTAAPREVEATVTVTGRTVDVSAAPPSGLGDDWPEVVRIVSAEWPVGRWPPTYVRFGLFGVQLTLHTDRELAGEGVAIRYEVAHTLDENGTTISDVHLELLAAGAVCYAVEQLMVARIDRLSAVPELQVDLERIRASRCEAWREGLSRLRRRVRTHATYATVDPYVSPEIDQGA